MGSHDRLDVVFGDRLGLPGSAISVTADLRTLISGTGWTATVGFFRTLLRMSAELPFVQNTKHRRLANKYKRKLMSARRSGKWRIALLAFSVTQFSRGTYGLHFDGVQECDLDANRMSLSPMAEIALLTSSV